MGCFRCPRCSGLIFFSGEKSNAHTYSMAVNQQFNEAIPATYPQRQTPQPQTRSSDIEPGTTHNITHMRPETPIDVGTKALNAIGFGLAVACASTLTVWLHWLPWYTPFAAILPAAGLAWFAVSIKPSDVVTFTENLTRIDLNGDGRVGDIAPAPERMVRVAVETAPGHDTRFDFLDTPKMWSFARAVLNGAPFNEEAANEHLGYGRKKWLRFRDAFFERTWARWKNDEHHQDGILLLGEGRSALRGCLPHSDDPSA